jgi:hypothetical protein
MNKLISILAVGLACLTLCSCTTINDWVHNIIPGAVTNVVVIPPIIAPTNNPTPTGDTCKLDGPLCDPDPSKFTPEYMDKDGPHAEFEDVGVERELKIVMRTLFVRGTSGGFYTLSSLAMKHVSRNADGSPHGECFTENGIRYHVRGYTNGDVNGPYQPQDSMNGAYFCVWECRKL